MIPDLTGVPIAELVSLRGRTAVVTGGEQGTGAGIVRRLGEAGAHVVVPDVDLTDEEAVRSFADGLAAERGSLDIWVNNAGVYPGAPVLEMTAAQWDEVLDRNLKSAFLGSQAAARHMAAAGRGVIVNIGSTASFRAYARGAAHYVASKFGMRGLTQALATELGPHGVRVLHVAPTFTATPGVRARRLDLDDEAYAAWLADAGAAKPLGRVGVPDDVGRVVLFCASDLSAFMTGSTLAVDAGDLAR